MDADYISKLNFRLVGVITLALVLALSSIVIVSLQLAEKFVVPELQAKAVTQGQALTVLIGQPLSYNIPVSELVGIDVLFKEVAHDNPEFGFLAISDEKGKILHRFGDDSAEAAKYAKNTGLLTEAAKLAESGAKPKSSRIGKHHLVSLPIFSSEHSIIALLHIGIKTAFVQNILNELMLDLAVILIVSLFLAYEVLYFITGGKLAGQFEMLSSTIGAVINNDFTRRGYLAGRDELGRVAALVDSTISKVNDRYAALLAKAQQAGVLIAPGDTASPLDIRNRFNFGESGKGALSYINYLGILRAPLFLSFIAEDLSRSFIPLFAKQLYRPIPGVSTELILSLPIMIFMMLIALLQPPLAAWSERVGRKHSLLTGMMIGCLAFIMTANAFTVYDLLLWRALSGVSWAIIFVASQGLILDKATAETRTRDIAFFVGVIMASSLCGPPIGGILADNIGFRATFYVSAGLSLAAVIFMLRFMPGDVVTANSSRQKLGFTDIISVFSNRRFVLLVLTAGIPAKMALIGYCFYLIPLYVTHLGDSAAMTGRILMIYGVVMVLGVPVAARISDKLQKRKEFVGIGLLLTGVSGFFILLGSNIYMTICLVLGLGLAQAISIAPQTAFVTDICQEEISRLGEGTVYGVYRLMERIGNFMGPFLAALLLNFFGFKGAFGIIALLLVISGIIFIAFFSRSNSLTKLSDSVEGVKR